MGKRTSSFKLRLSRVIPTFQSCRPKQPSNLLPITPVLPTYFHVSPINPKFIPAPQPESRSHPSSIKRHVSSAVVSIGCGCVPKSGARYVKPADESINKSNEFRWKKEEKWHVVARVKEQVLEDVVEEEEEEETPRLKIYNSSVSGVSDGDMAKSTPLPEKKKKKKQRNKKNKSKPERVRLSISSIDSGWFSSEGGGGDDEETETLVSSTSRTISIDSSSDQFDSRHLETIRESPINYDSTRKKKKKKKNNNNNSKRMIKKTKVCYASKSTTKGSGEMLLTSPSPESYSPARLSVLMPCKVEGKVKESFAVVKKSENPYEDFKRSMLEMILEKQMFEARDLEQLLNCFLSLNSRHHHSIIVEAFSDIWELLFSQSPILPQLVVSETDRSSAS